MLGRRSKEAENVYHFPNTTRLYSLNNSKQSLLHIYLLAIKYSHLTHLPSDGGSVHLFTFRYQHRTETRSTSLGDIYWRCEPSEMMRNENGRKSDVTFPLIFSALHRRTAAEWIVIWAHRFRLKRAFCQLPSNVNETVNRSHQLLAVAHQRMGFDRRWFAAIADAKQRNRSQCNNARSCARLLSFALSR